MKLSTFDRDALLAVSPAALSAYARVARWRRQGPYCVHSDVYEGTGPPEIIIPQSDYYRAIRGPQDEGARRDAG